jgi:hypothetical protein
VKAVFGNAGRHVDIDIDNPVCRDVCRKNGIKRLVHAHDPLKPLWF